MSNTPGSRMGADPEFFLGPVFAKLEHLGFLGESYAIPLDDLLDAVTAGYEKGILVKNEVPPPHSAYSSKLPEGRKQKMHSRGLPI